MPLCSALSYGQVAQHRQDEILTEMAKAGGVAAATVERPLIVVEPERLEKLERMIAELGGNPDVLRGNCHPTCCVRVARGWGFAGTARAEMGAKRFAEHYRPLMHV